MHAYIHERTDWPQFRWNWEAIHAPLAAARNRQGVLFGKMAGLGFTLREGVVLDALTAEVQKSSEIEGEVLDRDQVRSSLARRLGMDVGAVATEDRRVDGVVEVVLDATQRYEAPLTAERLWGWHASLMPTGYSGLTRILVGQWRTDRKGPMQFVSGHIGHERVHFQAPAAARLEEEMRRFLAWFEAPCTGDTLLRAGLAHLWFVTIHPFEDGNGRIARAIADMSLARAEQTSQRFYSMSAQIRRERPDYYRALEETQRGDLDVTEWMTWFLGCLRRAIEGAEQEIDRVLERRNFWRTIEDVVLNDRQRRMIRRLLEGFEGKLTTKKWAQLSKCSHDTALRDIQDLVSHGVLIQEAAGRSASYTLRDHTTAG